MGLVDFTVGDDGAESNSPASASSAASASDPKRFLGIKFECANGAYTRFYPNATNDAYIGRCPKCLKQVRFRIGFGGTSARFFTYNCNRNG